MAYYTVTLRVMQFDTKQEAHDFQEIMTDAFMSWKESEGKAAFSSVDENEEMEE